MKSMQNIKQYRYAYFSLNYSEVFKNKHLPLLELVENNNFYNILFFISRRLWCKENFYRELNNPYTFAHSLTPKWPLWIQSEVHVYAIFVRIEINVNGS